MSRVNWRAVAFHVGCISAGVILGLFLSRKWDIKPEVRFDTLATLLLSIVMFLIINVLIQQQSQVAQRESTDRRKEKDLLMKLLEQVLEAADQVDDVFRECHSMQQLGPENASRVKNALQRYNNLASTAGAALEKCGIEKKSVGFDEVEGQRSAYRDILTDDPFPAAFREGIYREQQGHHKKVRDTIVGVILTVNRLDKSLALQILPPDVTSR